MVRGRPIKPDTHLYVTVSPFWKLVLVPTLFTVLDFFDGTVHVVPEIKGEHIAEGIDEKQV
jgi:hypothetical protein